MTNTVDYLPIANGGSANVESQAQYLIDLASGGSLVNGYLAGLAKSNQMNKTWRQSSMMTAALANFISSELAIDVLDDGNLTTLIANLTLAIKASSSVVVGSARNLTGSAAGSTVTASWTADELVAETALGGLAYKGSSLTLAFNGAGTGAGGMDTGSVPTAADLNIYAIYNPTTATWNTLGTVTGHGAIYSGTHMPAGYTASALIWAGVTSGGHLPAFNQVDRAISLGNGNVLSSGTATTYTSVSLSAFVPAAAKTVSGNCNGLSGTLSLAANTGAIGFQYGANGVGGQYSVSLITPQTVYYLVSAGSGSIWVVSYTI